MAVELIIMAEAEQDLQDSYDWYEKRRFGLGEDFLGCVETCIRQICRSPEIYAKVHEDYRRALVRRFPYAIFFELTTDVLTVYCILHTSRDAAKWRERLP